MTALITAVRRWTCPNCPVTDVTSESLPHTRFHACAGLKGLTAPMVLAGTKAKVTAHEREDFIDGEEVQLSPDGRPIMSVVTEREDGQDVVVFAPRATAKSEEL